MDASVEEIFGYGLHEWLTDIIVETNHLAGRIAVDYGFTARP